MISFCCHSYATNCATVDQTTHENAVSKPADETINYSPPSVSTITYQDSKTVTTSYSRKYIYYFYTIKGPYSPGCGSGMIVGGGSLSIPSGMSYSATLGIDDTFSVGITYNPGSSVPYSFAAVTYPGEACRKYTTIQHYSIRCKREDRNIIAVYETDGFGGWDEILTWDNTGDNPQITRFVTGILQYYMKNEWCDNSI